MKERKQLNQSVRKGRREKGREGTKGRRNVQRLKFFLSLVSFPSKNENGGKIKEAERG